MSNHAHPPRQALAALLLALALPLALPAQQVTPPLKTNPAPAAPAAAAPTAKHPIDIPAGAVETAVKTLSRQTNVDILVPTKIVRGHRTNPVKGNYTPREAIDIMLANTGLIAEQDTQSGILTVRKAPAPPAPPATPNDNVNLADSQE